MNVYIEVEINMSEEDYKNVNDKENRENFSESELLNIYYSCTEG